MTAVVAAESFYIGHLKGIGKQLTAIDATRMGVVNRTRRRNKLGCGTS